MEAHGGALRADERCTFALGLLEAEQPELACREAMLAVERARVEADATTEALGLAVLGRCRELAAEAARELEGKHALVVEDDAEVRGLLAAFLRHLGLTVSEAFDGHDAYERLAEFEVTGLVPDLVVCDVSMPRCTGPELFERLRERGVRLPFLFVSAYRGHHLDGLPLQSEGVDFLEKPLDIDLLAARLCALLTSPF